MIVIIQCDGNLATLLHAHIRKRNNNGSIGVGNVGNSKEATCDLNVQFTIEHCNYVKLSVVFYFFGIYTTEKKLEQETVTQRASSREKRLSIANIFSLL